MTALIFTKKWRESRRVKRELEALKEKLEAAQKSIDTRRKVGLSAKLLFYYIENTHPESSLLTALRKAKVLANNDLMSAISYRDEIQAELKAHAT